MSWLHLGTPNTVLAGSADFLLTLCSTILGIDTNKLCDNYRLWGPSTSLCIDLTAGIISTKRHEYDVNQAAHAVTKSNSELDLLCFIDKPSSKIFVSRPAPDAERDVPFVDFGTKHLRGLVARAYARQSNIVRLTFYKTIRGLPWFGSLAGKMYEIHVLLWIQHSQDQTSLLCTGAKANYPELQIPACPGNLKYFAKVAELAKLEEPVPGHPICVVPTSETFPSFDAFIVTDDAITTLQITISRRHSAKETGFEGLYKNLPAKFLAKRSQRSHVFITDEEDNAKKLREQNLPYIPEGTYVFSAVIPIEDLESKVPLTETIVEELESKSKSMLYSMQ